MKRALYLTALPALAMAGAAQAQTAQLTYTVTISGTLTSGTTVTVGPTTSGSTSTTKDTYKLVTRSFTNNDVLTALLDAGSLQNPKITGYSLQMIQSDSTDPTTRALWAVNPGNTKTGVVADSVQVDPTLFDFAGQGIYVSQAMKGTDKIVSTGSGYYGDVVTGYTQSVTSISAGGAPVIFGITASALGTSTMTGKSASYTMSNYYGTPVSGKLFYSSETDSATFSGQGGDGSYQGPFDLSDSSTWSGIVQGKIKMGPPKVTVTTSSGYY